MGVFSKLLKTVRCEFSFFSSGVETEAVELCETPCVNKENIYMLFMLLKHGFSLFPTGVGLPYVNLFIASVMGFVYRFCTVKSIRSVKYLSLLMHGNCFITVPRICTGTYRLCCVFYYNLYNS